MQRLKRIIALLKTGQAIPDTELAELEKGGEEGGGAASSSPASGPRTPGASGLLPEDDSAYDDGPVHRAEAGDGAPGTPAH